EERRAVGGAVPGDREGARLPGHHRAGHVAGALLQVVAADALDDDLLHLDLGDLDQGDALADGDGLAGAAGAPGGGDARLGAPALLQLPAKRVLLVVRGGVRPNELVEQEEEDEATEPDQRPARAAQEPPHRHLLLPTIAISYAAASGERP